MQPKKLFILATVSFVLSLCFVSGIFAVWDKTKPADTTVFRQADDLIRANNTAIETALDAEHAFTTGGTQTGAHAPGGASILEYDTTTNIDSNVTATGVYVYKGLIFDTTLNQFFTMNAAATAKVAIALGPEAIAGAILDEDDMATDSATKVPSQQSTKAFVTSGTVTMSNKTLTAPVINGPLTSGTAVELTTLGTDAGVLPDEAVVSTAIALYKPQTVTASASANTSIVTAAVMPYDTSIPQNTEGVEIVTAAITPKSATSKLLIEAQATATFAGWSGTQYMIAGLFQDSTANALSANVTPIGAAGTYSVRVHYVMTSGTTSETTFKLRVGGALNSGTGTITSAAGSVLGGVAKTTLTVTEIMP